MIGDKRRQEENRGGDICKGTSKSQSRRCVVKQILVIRLI